MPRRQRSGLFVAPVQNLAWGGVFKLKDTGYPVFRFVKDIVVNNREVIDEQARMAELSNMKDTWNVLAVKPKYHTYVVVIGESARRDALGAFGGHWNNTPFASSVNGALFTDYVAASGSTQKSLGLTLSRVVDGNRSTRITLSRWPTAPVSRRGGFPIRAKSENMTRRLPALPSVPMKLSS